MFDDLKCSPKDEDEMEDFRDYGDESDDVDSKLDDYEEDEDEEDEEEESPNPIIAAIVAVAEEISPSGSETDESKEPPAESQPERKPVKSARKASPKKA